MEILKAEHVTKIYGTGENQVKALDDVSFSVNKGEFLAIIGRLNREQGVTVIMVTHDPLIASYSSRLVYIKDGLIERNMERGRMSQKEYFDKITEINASESRGFLQ